MRVDRREITKTRGIFPSKKDQARHARYKISHIHEKLLDAHARSELEEIMAGIGGGSYGQTAGLRKTGGSGGGPFGDGGALIHSGALGMASTIPHRFIIGDEDTRRN